MKLQHLCENEIFNITDPKKAYFYACRQGKRIPELEPIILKSSQYAYYYAHNVIKGRWPEAEPIVMQDPYWANLYLLHTPEARTPSKDVPLLLCGYIFTNVPNTISDEQVEKLIKIIEPNIEGTDFIKYYRIYFEPTIKQKIADKEVNQINTKRLLNDKIIRKAFFEILSSSLYNKTDFE